MEFPRASEMEELSPEVRKKVAVIAHAFKQDLKEHQTALEKHLEEHALTEENLEKSRKKAYQSFLSGLVESGRFLGLKEKEVKNLLEDVRSGRFDPHIEEVSKKNELRLGVDGPRIEKRVREVKEARTRKPL